MNSIELIKKYNVPTPRYTSYPALPNWNPNPPTTKEWVDAVVNSYNKESKRGGIAIYMHLPYCESLCTYCGCNTRITKNHSVEIPYINTLIKEWKMYEEIVGEKPLISEIHLGGGTPTFFSSENLKLLIESITENCKLSSTTNFSFEAHPANTSEEHLQTLFDLGFRRLSLGIQDFNLEVQTIINRKQSVEQVKFVTETARKIGYTSINYDLIYGLPKQNDKTITETIEEVIRLKPDRIAFYAYAHVPWVKPGQRAYDEQDLPSNEKKLDLYLKGKSLLTNNNYIDIGMDHFSLPTDELFIAQQENRLNRNFMGYTTTNSNLVIGLGVSSISFTGDCYMQNEKDLKNYTNKIEHEAFAILKGHALSNKEKIIYYHIQNLMCNFKTSWEDPTMNSLELQEGLNNMGDFVLEGLIEIKHHELKITTTGKSFIRNICAALDFHLYESIGEKKRFSNSI